MDQKAVVKNVLDTVFPDEVFIVGPTIVNRLIEGYRQIVRTEGGSNLDNSTSVGLITQAIGLITVLIQLYLVYLDSNKRRPTPTELRAEASVKNIDFSSLTDQQTQDLINTLTKELEEQDLLS